MRPSHVSMQIHIWHEWLWQNLAFRPSGYPHTRQAKSAALVCEGIMTATSIRSNVQEQQTLEHVMKQRGELGERVLFRSPPMGEALCCLDSCYRPAAHESAVLRAPVTGGPLAWRCMQPGALLQRCGPPSSGHGLGCPPHSRAARPMLPQSICQGHTVLHPQRKGYLGEILKVDLLGIAPTVILLPLTL